VILNLATNARDAMPEGGDLTVSAISTVQGDSTRAPQLKAGRYVRINVTDTGVGMTPEVLGRAAEPFFTTKSKAMGTGLGVSMAKGFAEQSGGAFAIASAPGKGTSVTLWLPQADGSPEAAPDDPVADAAALGAVGTGRCVLVVDDDEQVRGVLVGACEDAGYLAVGADGAESALALLGPHIAIDALVTDFSMPGMNGVDLIREIHRDRPDLPAILVTGHVGDVAAAAVDQQLTEGFTLLQKPVKPTKLVEQLASLIAVGVGR
jgi:CheY-like chemotaxis protein